MDIFPSIPRMKVQNLYQHEIINQGFVFVVYFGDQTYTPRQKSLTNGIITWG